MRSIISFAVLVAVLGFTGCKSTGGSGRFADRDCRLGNRAASGSCGCDGAVYSDPGMIEYSDGGCGCGGDTYSTAAAPYEYSGGYDGGCGGSPVVSPEQFSAPMSGGCSTCDGASARPGRIRSRIRGEGMGMGVQDQGIACKAGGVGGRGGCAERKSARSLRPSGRRTSLTERFGFESTEGSIVGVEEYDLVSDEFVTGPGINGRRISHGFISDVRGIRGGQFGGRAIGSRAIGGGGCGRGGCGGGGKLCSGCSKFRNLAGIGGGNPYGGAVPHTAQQPGQSGIAPSYAYPYYTTRGPRDFLRDNPPSIGR